MSNRTRCATILCGPSQTGKSTFTNILSADSAAAVGRGDGTSVTSQAQTYQTRIGLLQEIPGYNDSRLKVSNEETALQSAAQLAEHGVERVRFGVVESLSGDTTQLRASVSELVRQFGESVKGSIFVLATKRDRADEDELPLRLDAMRATMADLGIGTNLVVWKSKHMDERELDQQLAQLNDAINATKPVASTQLQQLNDRIQELAQQLCNDQEPERWTETVSVQEDYLEPVKYRESYEDTHYRPRNMSKLDRDAQKSPFWTGIRHVGTFGVATVVQACRNHTEWEKVTETKYRDAIKYESRSRQVSKEVPMERLREVEDFIPQARQEIIDKIRADSMA